MQPSDQDVVARLTALGRTGVEQLVEFLGARHPHDSAQVKTADKRTAPAKTTRPS